MFKKKPKQNNSLKNKKGILSIEAVMCTFIFLIVLCFFLDLLMLSFKFYTVSQVNNKIIRIASRQGGILATAPVGYPDGNNDYVNSAQLNSSLESTLNSSGIDTYTITYPTTEVDYGNILETRVTISYDWAFTSNFIPTMITQELTSVRTGVSEFKYRDSTFRGEY